MLKLIVTCKFVHNFFSDKNSKLTNQILSLGPRLRISDSSLKQVGLQLGINLLVTMIMTTYRM
jgi:hypothetical protein